MADAPVEFYDRLADSYHLIFEDWERSVRRQGEVLDDLLRARMGGGRLSVLDCACGIGTQAIGLALRGHKVHATDISPRSVERARIGAEAFNVSLSFGVADFRSLDRGVSGTFDAVICCDNALPHMLSDGDLRLALRSIGSKIRPGGLFLGSIRDYDRLVRERPGAETPTVLGGPGDRRVYFQIWDWADDGRTYALHLFLLTEVSGRWETRHYETRYRAVLRAEMGELLGETGFREIEWHAPDESGYHQPVVTARKVP